MLGEFILEYLPQEMALIVVLFFGGIILLFYVGLGGIGDRSLPKQLRWVLGFLAIIPICIGAAGYIQLRSESTDNTPESNEEKDLSIEPQLTEQPFYPAALFVKESFDDINNAGNLQDVATLMPKIFAPNLQRSADFWWDVKVKYEIYGCEENIIDVYLEYFNRSDTFYNKKINDSFSRHTLDFKNNEWIIIDGEDISGTNCTQVFP